MSEGLGQKWLLVAGARPNFMKVAPLLGEIKKHVGIQALLVHTGQHYDESLSQIFFEELGLPGPVINLGVGSGSHAIQTAEIMKRFEPVLLAEKPGLVIVVGDVNSTIACALTAVKLGIKVAHVEAGLRSFDRTMPEEINRVLTDAIADFLFITEESARDNLLNEGIAGEKIFFVGNTMIDTLMAFKEKAGQSRILEQLKLVPGQFGLLTLHRPANVDSLKDLQNICGALEKISKKIPLVFPVHPRTAERLAGYGLKGGLDKGGLMILPPLGYLDFIHLMSQACLVLTDSGGIQEETSILGVPCLTLRENTERPITVEKGTNRIVGNNPADIIMAVQEILEKKGKKRVNIDYWDGKAAGRIVECLKEQLEK